MNKEQKKWALPKHQSCNSDRILTYLLTTLSSLSAAKTCPEPRDWRKNIIYKHFVCTIRPKKAERIARGQPLVVTESTIQVKLQYSLLICWWPRYSSISQFLQNTPKFMTIDISNFMTLLKRPKYVRMKITVPKEMILGQQYTSASLSLTIEICINHDNPRNVLPYGLSQAGLQANEDFRPTMCSRSASTRRTNSRANLCMLYGSISCVQSSLHTLVVNDFGVKYQGKWHIHHLKHTLKKHYSAVTTDWTGNRQASRPTRTTSPSRSTYPCHAGQTIKPSSKFNIK